MAPSEDASSLATYVLGPGDISWPSATGLRTDGIIGEGVGD